MLVRMKNSSMKTAPKGRMPPTSTLKAGCMYHACAQLLAQDSCTFQTSGSLAHQENGRVLPLSTLQTTQVSSSGAWRALFMSLHERLSGSGLAPNACCKLQCNLHWTRQQRQADQSTHCDAWLPQACSQGIRWLVCSAIWRGILFVRTESSGASLQEPK